MPATTPPFVRISGKIFPFPGLHHCYSRVSVKSPQGTVPHSPIAALNSGTPKPLRLITALRADESQLIVPYGHYNQWVNLESI